MAEKTPEMCYPGLFIGQIVNFWGDVLHISLLDYVHQNIYISRIVYQAFWRFDVYMFNNIYALNEDHLI